MRIAVGQLWQETNTFNRNSTNLNAFRDWGIAQGAEVLTRYGNTGEIGGFVDECRTWNSAIELVGLTRMACWPWGAVDADTWKWIRETFTNSLRTAGQIDGVLLALHGAMCADGEPDVTGRLLELAREVVGPKIPIVGTLDLHANVTTRMLQAADVLVGYHTSPHLDHFETGQRGVRSLRRMIEDGVRPAKYSQKIPMMTPAESHNSFTGTPAPLYRQLEALERDPRVLSAGLYMVMPWFDCPELGWTVTLHTTKPDAHWDDVVQGLADECWNLRHAMCEIDRLSPSEAVAKAKSIGHPVVIGDGADATNSGAPGDSTGLLRELLKQQPIPYGAMTFVVDPEAVTAAHNAGVAGNFDMHVGASFSPEFSDPVRVRGTVEKLLRVEFILNGHGGKQMPINMGRGAVVKSGDVSVLFTERSGVGSSPLLYETAGLKPRECGIVIAKSPAGFRADYEPFCKAVILADGPGCATPNWHRLKFEHINQPLWPLQEINSPEEATWCTGERPA
jgi:microcystin degradation protein MlrC